MKIRFYVPLILVLSFQMSMSIFYMPREISMILSYGSFLFFFTLTYHMGVHHSFHNSIVVARGLSASPYLMPIFMFAFPALIMTFFMIPRDRDIISSFAISFTISILAYGIGMIMVIRECKLCYKRIIAERQKLLKPGEKRGKRLILINPASKVNSGLNACESSKFPPLGLGIIAALTPQDYEVIIIDENYDTYRFIDADLVGITAFTSAVVRGYSIAAEYRAKGIPVVMGGIHASMVPEEAERHVDSVVIGEAESVWPQLIQDFEAGRLQKRYTGQRLSLEKMPFPRRDLFHPEYLFATIQTSRGCPMNCNFCTVTAFNGNQYRQRPTSEVLDELESIEQDFIFFVDDNIIGYGKDAEGRAIDLFKGMIQRKIKKTWFCQASLNFGFNRELLRWAGKSGCRMVFLGLEGIEDADLASMNKGLNQKLDYETAFRNIHQAGISVLGAFIFGTETDTEEKIQKKADYILKAPIDVMQVTTLTPLPGTALYEKYRQEKRLLYTDYPSDWLHYDMTELVFRLNRMENNVFSTASQGSQKRFFSPWRLALKFLGTFLRTGSMEAAMWALDSNLVYRKAFLVANEKR